VSFTSLPFLSKFLQQNLKEYYALALDLSIAYTAEKHPGADRLPKKTKNTKKKNQLPPMASDHATPLLTTFMN
jgi:hypothetical protein